MIMLHPESNELSIAYSLIPNVNQILQLQPNFISIVSDNADNTDNAENTDNKDMFGNFHDVFTILTIYSE